MTFSRRIVLAAGTAGAVAAAAAPAAASPVLGLDAADLGIKPDAPQDQTHTLQRAIDRAAQ
ncbi:MAG: TIGR03808 family TAT-translocated repetitive protein, partial [Pseudorhodoplanes sp.]